jgi:hypothetical protein
MEKEDKKSELARKIAKNKVSFIKHGATYLIVMAALAVINNVTSPGYQWWLWPALGWGIGLAFHFADAFLFKGMSLKRLEDELTKRELEKMKEPK